jgi:hypothetical protein
MSGMVAGQIPIAATATSVTSSTGSLPASFMPAFTGDVTSSAGSTVTTLPTVNANVGTFQGLTVNAKGLVTAAANQSYAPLANPVFTTSIKVGGNANPTLAIVAGGYTGFYAPDGTGTTGGLFYGTVAGTSGAALYRNTSHSFQDNGGTVARAAIATGLVVGAPTGGDKGAGTINAVSVSANNVVLTSDAALKQDIEPLPPCLGMVEAITPRSFRWKEPERPMRPDGDGRTDLADLIPSGFLEQTNRGFLAQDVAKVLGGDSETVDLGGLVAVLWQAVRELSARVESMEGAP